MKRTELFHNNRRESLRKLESIRCNRFEISGVEGLLKTCEQMEERDMDNERRLRAKLRAKKNQLQAMCPL